MATAVITLRYYDIRRNDLVVDHALGPFAAPTLTDAVSIADRRVGGDGLRWGSWELVDHETGRIVAHGSAPQVGAAARRSVAGR